MAHSNVRILTFTLQDTFRPKDSEWSFSISNLPSPSTLISLGFMKSVSVVSNATTENMILRFVKLSPNRAMPKDLADRFMSISFADFRLRYRSDNHTVDGEAVSESAFATSRESTDYVVRLLETGLIINGVTYHFYGHSNSQLKSRTCVLFAASKDEISNKIDGMGGFDKMKTVAKKAKRIGLLFSVAETSCGLEEECYEDIPDIISKDYNFTDGCGLIAGQFAKQLVKKMDIKFRNQRYIPSVFQIRYRGYKGVLMIDPTMKGKTKVKFRNSMRKFKGGDDMSFSVIEYAKVTAGLFQRHIRMALESPS